MDKLNEKNIRGYTVIKLRRDSPWENPLLHIKKVLTYSVNRFLAAMALLTALWTSIHLDMASLAVLMERLHPVCTLVALWAWVAELPLVMAGLALFNTFCSMLLMIIDGSRLFVANLLNLNVPLGTSGIKDKRQYKDHCQ
jgi:hypothetical protein